MGMKSISLETTWPFRSPDYQFVLQIDPHVIASTLNHPLIFNLTSMPSSANTIKAGHTMWQQFKRMNSVNRENVPLVTIIGTTVLCGRLASPSLSLILVGFLTSKPILLYDATVSSELYILQDWPTSTAPFMKTGWWLCWVLRFVNKSALTIIPTCFSFPHFEQQSDLSVHLIRSLRHQVMQRCSQWALKRIRQSQSLLLMHDVFVRAL